MHGRAGTSAAEGTTRGTECGFTHGSSADELQSDFAHEQTCGDTSSTTPAKLTSKFDDDSHHSRALSKGKRSHLTRLFPSDSDGAPLVTIDAALSFDPSVLPNESLIQLLDGAGGVSMPDRISRHLWSGYARELPERVRGEMPHMQMSTAIHRTADCTADSLFLFVARLPVCFPQCQLSNSTTVMRVNPLDARSRHF
jgi:hypothetical protein